MVNRPRITPVAPPYEPEVDTLLRRMMPANTPVPPLALFRTLARHRPLSTAMEALGSYVLGRKADRDKGLPSRVRELVILRTTARCRCEYEWGVHAVAFGARVGLTEEQIAETVMGDGTSLCWSVADAAVIRCVDALHDQADVPDEIWSECRNLLGEEQMIELLLVAGWYHAISFVAKGARVEPEPWAPTFPVRT